MGIVSPLGIGTEVSWKACKEGKSGIRRITQFDPHGFNSQIAGEVDGFDPLNWVEKKEARKMGRFIHFAVAASEFAIRMANLGVDPEDGDRTGVYIGSGIGGFEIIEREHKNLLEKGPGRISPFFIPATIINLASGYVSIRIGAKGPNSAVATACATSTHAIGDAFRLIQHDEADVMICGGAEGCITPMGVGGFAAMRALSQRNDDPVHASRPWDKDRDGFVVGEGAGVLVIEDLEHAQRRNAPILAEVCGYGMSADAYHITSGAEDGDGVVRVMNRALADAGIPPSAIDYINAHATSTEIGDRLETIAIKRCFGEHARKLAISSTKSMHGHLLGAAGGLEAGLSVLALRDQVAPPTINLANPDPDCDLDYVAHTARPMKIDYVLSNSFGFGGTNGCLIFRKFEN